MNNQTIATDKQARRNMAQFLNAECPDIETRANAFKPYGVEQ